LAGHEDLRTTSVYIGLAPTELQQTIALLDEPALAPMSSPEPAAPRWGAPVEPRPLMSWELMEERRRAEELLRRTSY